MSRLECERWASQFDQESTDTDSAETSLSAQHLKQCAECSREAQVWRELATLVPSETELVARDLRLERAVLQELDVPSVRSKPRAPRRTWLWGGLAAAALVASVSILIWPRPSDQLANFTVGNGTAYDAQGRTHTLGDRLSVGQTVSAGAEPLCLLIESGVRACLAPDSSVTLTDMALAHRRLELEHGRIVAQLEKQPAGTSFSISTPAGVATAVGTVFAVERTRDDSSTDVRVLEGAVVVQQSGEQHTLRAGQGKHLVRATQSYELETTERQRDLSLLSSAEASRPASDVKQQPPVETRTEPAGKSQPTEPSSSGRVPQAKRTAADLLQRALRLRADGQFSKAAAIYRRLQSEFPGSGEARASLVSFGDLQLSRLGDAAGALRSFDAYLKSGGALSREARYGRIRALRALGRVAEERAAIEQMLEQHPSGLYAASLRKRLKELE